MSNGMNIVLEVNGQQYRLSNRELRIGRGPTNQINLSDTEASRNHAAVWASQGIAFIRDAGSHNGTFVNEERISGQRTLTLGDRIRIGKTLINVQMGIGTGEVSSNVGLFAGVIAILAIALISVLAFVLITNSNSAAPRSAPNPGAAGPLTSPALATVVIENLNGTAQIGSGILVSPRGYILTSAVALAQAQLIVPEGCQSTPPDVLVGLIPEEARPPEKFYRAQIFCGDPGSGLALLSITATDGGGPLPPNLIFPQAILGNSDVLQLGSAINIIGFPGLGSSIKSIPGNISEFLPGLKGPRTWLTTHMVVDPGMPGGMVVANGQVIAMPTNLTPTTPLVCQPTCLIPINAAQGLMSQVR